MVCDKEWWFKVIQQNSMGDKRRITVVPPSSSLQLARSPTKFHALSQAPRHFSKSMPRGTDKFLPLLYAFFQRPFIKTFILHTFQNSGYFLLHRRCIAG